MKVFFDIDYKAKFRFYLRVFFDFLDMSVDFWFSLACSMIGNFRNKKTVVPTSRSLKRSKGENAMVVDHLPQFAATRARCAYCSAEQVESRTFICCISCKMSLLCLQRKKLFFLTSCNPANLFENWLYSCSYFKLLMTSLILSIIQKYKYGVIFYYNLLSNNTIY